MKHFFESEETYMQYLQAEKKIKMEKINESNFLQILKDIFKSFLPFFNSQYRYSNGIRN